MINFFYISSLIFSLFAQSSFGVTKKLQEDLSCRDVSVKEINYETMTEKEIEEILEQNFTKKVLRSDSSCVNLRSNASTSSSGSSAASNVSVQMPFEQPKGDAESYKSENKEISAEIKYPSSEKSSEPLISGAGIPACIKYITDENDMTKNLKESISVETDPETRKGLIENYMLLKGIKDTGDETCK